MEEAPGSCPARVLLVEDHDDSRALVAEALRMTGFQVAECPNADEALREAATRSIDLIVTDLGLGGMTGAELVRQLRSRPGLERIPALAVTGKADLSESERSAFDAVLLKPLEPAKLQRTIVMLLEKQRRAAEAPPPSLEPISSSP